MTIAIIVVGLLYRGPGADPGILERGAYPHANAEGAENIKGVFFTEGVQKIKLRVPKKHFPGTWDQNLMSYN